MAKTDDLQTLLDRQAIIDTISQYCRAFDRCDPDLLEGVYWPDSVHDHGIFVGSGPEFVEWATPKIRNYFTRSMHQMHNFYFDIRGNEANVESYVTAWHLIAGDAPTVELVFGADYAARHAESGASHHDFIYLGRYFDRLEKRGDEWRIKHRRLSAEWTINQPSTTIWSDALVAGMPFLGKRDRSDPSYFAA